MPFNTTRRRRRKAEAYAPNFGRDAQLLTIPGVRIVLSRVRVTPTVALVMAEAAGLIRETHHG